MGGPILGGSKVNHSHSQPKTLQQKKRYVQKTPQFLAVRSSPILPRAVPILAKHRGEGLQRTFQCWIARRLSPPRVGSTRKNGMGWFGELEVWEGEAFLWDFFGNLEIRKKNMGVVFRGSFRSWNFGCFCSWMMKHPIFIEEIFPPWKSCQPPLKTWKKKLLFGWWKFTPT